MQCKDNAMSTSTCRTSSGLQSCGRSRGVEMKIQVNPEKQADIEWSHQVKDRDHWQCVICGDDKRPNAHHLVDRQFRQYRWEVDNGLTLCVTHHKFSRVISAHNAPLAFFVWLQEHRPKQYVTACFRARDIQDEAGKT